MPPITDTKSSVPPVIPENKSAASNAEMLTEVEKQEIDKLSKLTAGFNPVVPIYMMHIRRGNKPPEIKSFQFDGNLQKAILRARNHCEKMGYRFCGAFPFLIDLDKEEKAYSDGTYSSERV